MEGQVEFSEEDKKFISVHQIEEQNSDYMKKKRLEEDIASLKNSIQKYRATIKEINELPNILVEDKEFNIDVGWGKLG